MQEFGCSFGPSELLGPKTCSCVYYTLIFIVFIFILLFSLIGKLQEWWRKWKAMAMPVKHFYIFIYWYLETDKYMTIYKHAINLFCFHTDGAHDYETVVY